MTPIVTVESAAHGGTISHEWSLGRRDFRSGYNFTLNSELVNVGGWFTVHRQHNAGQSDRNRQSPSDGDTRAQR